MQQVAIVGCGFYMDNCFGCPGDWKCFKAAAIGEGSFEAEAKIIAFVRCECPGRSVVPNLALALDKVGLKPDRIHLSTCMIKAKPDCPYATPDEFATMLANKTGIQVVKGTHDY